MKVILSVTFTLLSLTNILLAQDKKAETPKESAKGKKEATKNSKEAAPAKKMPIKITSDSMKYHENGLIIFFTGNVNVDDGDLKLNCDFMTVKLDKAQSPKLIICEKNVVIRKQGSISHSDRAEYFVPEEKIILTGSPKIVSTNEKGEKQTMTGNEITFYRNSNTIEAKRSTFELPGTATEQNKEKEQKK